MDVRGLYGDKCASMVKAHFEKAATPEYLEWVYSFAHSRKTVNDGEDTSYMGTDRERAEHLWAFNENVFRMAEKAGVRIDEMEDERETAFQIKDRWFKATDTPDVSYVTWIPERPQEWVTLC